MRTTGTDNIVQKVRVIYGEVIRSDLENPVRNIDAAQRILEKKYGLIVDKKLISLTFAAFMNGRPVLFEGPPGTGKTEIGEALLELWSGKRPFVLPCSENYDEYKVIGDFHPLLAMKVGFNEESFIPRPILASIILDTGILIDEIRRSSEEFQNMLLDISDKRRVIVPELKRVFKASGDGFQIIFTSNPEDIAQNELSDAFLRRVVRIEFNYPPRHVEAKIIDLRSRRDVTIPGYVKEIMMNVVESLRNTRLTYKPGTAELVMWARMSQAVAKLKGKQVVDTDDIVYAAKTILVKRPEDKAIILEVLRSVTSIDDAILS
ncbi:MAG: MoxR family ATPase [Desulfurococcales archaeon]|nr:MoxR family ATPase [Desulfurococcales archaeon]MEB3789627.1 MoxR family ATPase [Desulfurococcales archaeon]